MTYHVISANVGTHSSIKGWPTNDLTGLFEALSKWPLDRRFDLSGASGAMAPFKGMAWGHCVMQFDAKKQKRVPVATAPIYPDFPDAVEYCGNFLAHSFGFSLVTADKTLIAALDNAIALNLATVQ